MRPVVSRQHLMTETLVFSVDGSEVTTNDDDNTGLDYGSHLATIKKGEGADSNLITITLNNAFGVPPKVFIQERTLDCVARLEEEPTKTVIKIRTLELDGTTQEDNADLEVLVVGTRELREGNYG